MCAEKRRDRGNSVGERCLDQFAMLIVHVHTAFMMQVESALRALPGLSNVTTVRSESKGLSYYAADDAATLWYASSQLSKSLDVQTFDWDVTFEGLAGPQPLLQVSLLDHGHECLTPLVKPNTKARNRAWLTN